MNSRGRVWAGLALFLAACFAAAALGSIFTSTTLRTWYPTLEKPSWNPPAWVFGPVWTILYAMMACAAWLVWQRGGFGAARVPLALFGVQLALNAAWSPVFFGLRSPGGAFIVIVALWCAIVATVVSFFRRSAAAGWLLVPYLAWASFATALNFAIWRLNA